MTGGCWDDWGAGPCRSIERSVATEREDLRYEEAGVHERGNDSMYGPVERHR